VLCFRKISQVLILFFSFIAGDHCCQNRTIDSLKNTLINAGDTARINTWNKIAKESARPARDTSFKYASLALRMASEKQFVKGIIESYNNLAFFYMYSRNFDSSQIFFDRALKLNNHEIYKKQLAETYNGKGVIYYYRSDVETALEFFIKSLAIKEHLGDEREIVKSLSNIGSIYLAKSQLDKALVYYLKCAEMEEKLNDQRGLAADYLNIGVLYTDKLDYDIALKYLNKSTEIRKRLNDKLGLIDNYLNTGTVYYRTKKYKEALEQFNTSLRIAEHLKDKLQVGRVYNNIGLTYESLKEFKKALEFYEKSLKLKKETNDRMGVCIVLGNIGSVQALTGELAGAKKSLEESLQIAKADGLINFERKAHLDLSTVHSQLGNHVVALNHYKEYSALNDTIYSTESSKQIAEMQTKYETEKKEKQNALLISQNEISRLETQSQKTQRNAVIIISGFILFAGLILYNRYRLKHKNKMLEEINKRNIAVFQAQEEEKSRLSKELHDGVGPLLALIKLNASGIERGKADEKSIEEIKSLATQSIKEVRNISHALMPTVLHKKGLKEALAEFIRQINDLGELKVDFVYDLKTELIPQVQLNIYRIVQEAVTNSVKYAKAANLKVWLSEKNGNLHLLISDDGSGFEPEKTNNGNGLSNIYSRVSFLNGTANVTSGSEKGTSIDIQVPLHM
jgi:two-component system, NarL family, sensor kinase